MAHPLKASRCRGAILALLALLAAGCSGAADEPLNESPAAEAGPPSAAELIDVAARMARVDGRSVMVKFRASWCAWCARLDAVMHSYELGRTFDDNYVVVDLTVQESDDKKALETPGGQEFMDAVGGKEAGLPFYVFLDPEARTPIADSNVMPDGGNIGYPVAPEEIEAFTDLLARTGPRMTEERLADVVRGVAAHGP